jgi:GT2 family glycosyltransferase
VIKVMQKEKTYIVIPNWNGAGRIRSCLDSLRAQTQPHQTIVVDNGSVDDSVKIIESEYSEVTLIRHTKNKGFTGGVNTGIKYAIDQEAEYVALLNNDAVAAKDWLKNLVGSLSENPKTGIATSKICDDKKTHLDSTGDLYTIWGLPYPRGRGEPFSSKYDEDTTVFGASGGASLYRIKMLEQIGLFDDDFFAYYEDVDLSFRAQLAGWKVAYVPAALVYHEIGATSSSIKGFTTYHTIKNLPLIFWKDVPLALMPKVFPRLILAHWMFIFRAISRGQIWPVLKGIFMAVIYFPNTLWQRRNIQSSRKVSIEYINSIITHDLPPNAHKLRRLRGAWRKMVRRPA